MLFYSTGFRSGVSKRNNLSGTGLLRMGVNCIKFLDSNMVQFAFWGKNKYPTNIRITLTDMVYDNLKAVYIKVVQYGSNYVLSSNYVLCIKFLDLQSHAFHASMACLFSRLYVKKVTLMDLMD